MFNIKKIEKIRKPRFFRHNNTLCQRLYNNKNHFYFLHFKIKDYKFASMHKK